MEKLGYEEEPDSDSLSYEEEPDSDIELTEQHYHNNVSYPTPSYAAKVQQTFNNDGTIKRIITARKSAFVHNLVHLDGKKFDFTGREYLEPVYDRKDQDILLKTARQVEKTTFLANNLVATSVVVPFNKSLYVSPSHTQTRQFSNEKLRPAIEKSPFIKRYFQDHSVSTQVFEKGFTNGSYVFLRSAFRSADRCVARGTRVSLATGGLVKVEDLVEGTYLLSIDKGGQVVQPCRAVWSNGVKPTIIVTLRSGQEVTASVNHRWQTQEGILRTDELLGKWVPIPLGFFKSQVPGDETYDLLGFFLSDGCMAKNTHCSTFRTSFNNNDIEVIEAFELVCKKLNINTARTARLQNGKCNYTVRIHSSEDAQPILKNFGVLGKIWSDRFIPDCVFGSVDRTKRVLRGMFESDGWATCSTKNRQYEIGWVSGSLQLARDVQYCLQGLGVHSVLSSKEPQGRVKSVTYNVKIRSVEHIRKFSEHVGFISSRKNKVLKTILELSGEGTSESNTSPDCPARVEVNAALERAGIADYHLWENHKISWCRNSTVNGEKVSLQKVKKIFDLTSDERLKKYLDPEVLWVQVTKTVAGPTTEVFDLSVNDSEMFTANGVFTHNTRGISARVLCLDEIQDFLGSEIPVIMECTSHFHDALRFMAGTPKSNDNPIETYWQETTQNEWLVPCQHCGKWNFLDENCIAETSLYLEGALPPGPVCRKCRKPITVRLGRWMSTCPGKSIQGYRIPQLMVPWIVGLMDQWMRILWKRDNYPIGQLYNEVLGLSYDSASKPITRSELIDICESYDLWDVDNITPKTLAESKKLILTAGVDWGEGNDGSEKSPTGKIRNASYTVLTIGTYANQREFKVKAVKKYQGREVDPDHVVKDIARICKTLNVTLTGVDWGHGWGVNNHLMRILGPNKVVQFQYLPKLKQRMKWDPTGFRYHVQRNFMMSELFFDMKHGFVKFPRWVQIEQYAKDILAIYAEYVEYRREIKYDHKPSEPDDFFHSLNYSKLASDIHLGKSRKYTMDIPHE